MEDRLKKIESQLAHMERLYDDLNKIVIEQDKTIRSLNLLCRRLSDSLQGMELDRVRQTTSKPPHYSA
ncbi:MAG: hypothetical protein JWN25_3390 [Verrucomicrobiales bacterium]|jgi:uncharacterized coiled-coil protein SlyX|nr:hypothetical protein [Verrucomicrobiales bacterium]MDB6130151.1 hypothetical protein [Verrucomicrobiales bacterium]